MKTISLTLAFLIIIPVCASASDKATDRAIWIENAFDRITRSANPSHWSSLSIISTSYNGSRRINESNDRQILNWFRWEAENSYKTYPVNQPEIEGFEYANSVYEVAKEPWSIIGEGLQYKLKQVANEPRAQVSRWRDYNQSFFQYYANKDYEKREILASIYDTAKKDPKFAKLFNETYYSLIRAKTDDTAEAMLDGNPELATLRLLRDFVKGNAKLEERVATLEKSVREGLGNGAAETTNPSEKQASGNSPEPLQQLIDEQPRFRSAAEAEFENRGMHSAVSVLSRFMDPRTARQFSAISHAVIDLRALNIEYENLYAGREPSALGTAATAFNYIAIFFTIVDAFSEPAPPPEQIILEQLQVLAKQMQIYQEENRERFDRIDARLSQIFAAMNSQFQSLSDKIETVSYDTGIIRNAMAETLLQLDHMETSLTNYLLLVADQPFYREMKGCIGYQDRTGRKMSVMEYDACVNSIRAFIEDAKSPALSGAKSNGANPGDFARIVRSDDIPSQVNFFGSLLQERGGYVALPRLPNPIRWAQAANYFTTLAVQNEEIFRTTPKKTLEEILAQGKGIERTLSHDIPLDKAKFAKTLESLIQDYEFEARSVERAARASAQNSITEKAIATWTTPDELSSLLEEAVKKFSQREVLPATPWEVLEGGPLTPNPRDMWKKFGPIVRGAGVKFTPLKNREHLWREVFKEPCLPALELLGLGSLELRYNPDVDQPKLYGDYVVIWGKPFVTVFVYLLPNGASIPGKPIGLLPYRTMPFTMVYSELCDGRIGILSCVLLREYQGRERTFDWEAFLANETSLARHKVTISPTIEAVVESRLDQLLVEQHANLLRDFTSPESDLYRAVSRLDATVRTIRGMLSLVTPNVAVQDDELTAALYGSPNVQRCILSGSRVSKNKLPDLIASTALQLDPGNLGVVAAQAEPKQAETKVDLPVCTARTDNPLLPLLDRKGVEMLLRAGLLEDGQPYSPLLNQDTLLFNIDAYATRSAARFRARIAESLRSLTYEANRHFFLRLEIAKLQALTYIEAARH